VTEGTLLSLAGGLLGLLLALAARRPLLALFPRNIANLSIPQVSSFPLDGRVLGVSFVLTLLAGAIFGSAPALQHARPRFGALAESGRGVTQSRRSRRFRDVMAAIELSLALVLLATGGLLLASFRNLARGDFGFRTDHLLATEIFLAREKFPFAQPHKRLDFVEAVLARTRALPGVRAAAAVNFLPLSGFWSEAIFVPEGLPQPRPGHEPSADSRLVSPDYFATMGIPLLAGRAFTQRDRKGSMQVAIVSQAVARRVWGEASPLGRRLNAGDAKEPSWWTIVGVVGEVREMGLTELSHGDLYRPFAQIPYPQVAFVARTDGDPALLAQALERTIWSVDRDQPIYKALTIQGLADESLAVRRVTMLLLAVFSALALLLAAVGVYGVVAFSVAQRRHEIGLRMALGARPGQVLQIILAQGLRITMGGLAVGLVSTLVLTRLLAALLYGVSPTDALTLMAVSVLLSAIALAASYLPARRAAAVDPMLALRDA
jgi:predicted permease